MLEGLRIEQVGPQHFDLIRSVYDASNYKGGIRDEDIGILAMLHTQPVGGVRLTREHDVLMLRGMMVKPGYQRRGIGTKMLEVRDRHIATEPCYLVGRQHLQAFYGMIGFVTIADEEAPEFLVDRAKKYNEEWHTCIIMHRRGQDQNVFQS